MDFNQPLNQIHAKQQKIESSPNIVHAKYNTFTVYNITSFAEELHVTKHV